MILTHRALRRFLESEPSRQFGTNCETCPIATYLRSRGHPAAYADEISYSLTGAHGCETLFALWARAFTEAVVRWGWVHGGVISAPQAIHFLDEAVTWARQPR